MRTLTIAPLLALPLSAVLYANDSTAALEAGGLVMTKSEHIVMAKEDLLISQDKIRVAYQFHNTSNKAITTRVAFPLPSFSLDSDDAPFSELPNDKNVMKFSVVVNGIPQKFDTEDKQQSINNALFHQITHHWMQTFPANKTISVIHEYQPALGGAVGYGMQNENSGQYCLDKNLQQWVKQQQNTGFDIPTTTVAYVLKTGANWKGPIGQFKLTVKKSDPNEKISFCGTGIKKVDNKTFVMEKNNFTPTQDLHILYLKKPYNINAPTQ